MGFRPYQQYYTHLPTERWMMIPVKKQTFIRKFQCVCFLHIDDHSRIILKGNENPSGYINANYINVSINKIYECKHTFLDPWPSNFVLQELYSKYFFIAGNRCSETVHSFTRYYTLDYVLIILNSDVFLKRDKN